MDGMDSVSTKRSMGGDSSWAEEVRPLLSPLAVNNGSLAGNSGVLGNNNNSHNGFGHNGSSIFYDSDDDVRSHSLASRSPYRRINISLSAPVQGLHSKLRVECIDVMRGLVVLITVFVNNGKFTDPGWEWIGHEPWNGLYLGDCVWPMYLTVMGASMAFTFRKECPAPRKAVLYSLKRSLLLCLLGIFLKNFHGLGVPIDLSSLRIPSELGRVGICYFVVACMLIYLPRLKVRNGAGPALLRSFPELALYAWAWVLTLAMLVFYLIILFTLPVPGCPRGYLGPGGTSDGGAHFNCTGGATNYIDLQIFTSKHMGIWAGCQDAYNCVQIDSCSILGTLPSILHVMLGVLAGNILLLYRKRDQKAVVAHLLSWAVVMGLLGTMLHFTAIPINKTLWSLSFVLVTGAVANATLAAIYACMDWGPRLRFWILRSVGINPLLLYLFAELLEPLLDSLVFHNDRTDTLFHYIFDEGYAAITSQNVARLLWALTVATLTVLLSVFLRKRNVLVTL
eukprot:m.116994 g.116994  ORF g.116994 m.116994 type:complete len:508 (+) comp16084_c1_seq1:251-1774(+)